MLSLFLFLYEDDVFACDIYLKCNTQCRALATLYISSRSRRQNSQSDYIKLLHIRQSIVTTNKSSKVERWRSEWLQSGIGFKNSGQNWYRLLQNCPTQSVQIRPKHSTHTCIACSSSSIAIMQWANVLVLCANHANLLRHKQTEG